MATNNQPHRLHKGFQAYSEIGLSSPANDIHSFLCNVWQHIDNGTWELYIRYGLSRSSSDPCEFPLTQECARREAMQIIKQIMVMGKDFRYQVRG